MLLRTTIWVWIVPVLLAGVLSGCGGESDSESTDAGHRPTVPPPPKPSESYEPVPATVAQIDAAVAAEKGHVVLVDFWATWCGPCVQSFPTLVRHHNTFASKGLIVIAISMDDTDDKARVKEFLKRQDAGFTCYLMLPTDKTDEAIYRERFRPSGGIPHAVLFDKTGKRVWAGNPLENPRRLEQRIEAELAK